MWFDEEKTEAGRDALGFYHERRDSERNIGLGPEHDWSSHGADSFGLMAVHTSRRRRARISGARSTMGIRDGDEGDMSDVDKRRRMMVAIGGPTSLGL
jgi:hypothetical protein